jgi:hypothetical protein
LEQAAYKKLCGEFKSFCCGGAKNSIKVKRKNVKKIDCSETTLTGESGFTSVPPWGLNLGPS